MEIRGRFACAVLFAGATAATITAQVVPPSLIQRVDPDYGADTKSWLVDPANVQIAIDAEGRVLSLASVTSLPDGVVRAMAQWRFSAGTKNGRATGFTLGVKVPVRRSAASYLLKAHRPTSLQHTHANTAVDFAKLNPDSLPKIEKKLSDKPASSDQRAALLEYAAKHPDQDVEEMRVRQISWFVRNDPGAAILDSSTGLIFPSQGPMQDAAGYEAVKRLWQEQLAVDPKDPLVLGHASWFLQFAEPEKAEEMLLPAVGDTGGAAAWVGELYAYGVLGVNRMDTATNTPVSAGADASGGFATHAREALMTSQDNRIVLAAFDTLTRAAGALKRTGTVPKAFDEVCASLMKRVLVFDPANANSCDLSSVRGPGVAVAGSVVQSAKILKQMQPRYPPEAKARRLGGSVHFSAVIGKDGKLKDLELLSGPLLFYESSREPVLTWEYSPTRWNGEPQEVITQIDVNYSME